MNATRTAEIKSNESESMILKPVYRGVFSEGSLMGFDLRGIGGTAEYFCRFFKEGMKQKTAGIETGGNKIIFWNATERYSFDIAPSMLKSIKRILEGKETDDSFGEKTETLVFSSVYQIRTLKNITI